MMQSLWKSGSALLCSCSGWLGHGASTPISKSVKPARLAAMKNDRVTQSQLRDYHYAKAVEHSRLWRAAEVKVRAIDLEIEECRE